MPKDFKTGDCYCDICGNKYGNLYTDGLRIRARKYCKECSKKKHQADDREYQRNKRRTLREVNNHYRKALKEVSVYVKSLEEELGIRKNYLDELHKKSVTDIIYAKCGNCGEIQNRENDFCCRCGRKFIKS